MPRWTSEPPAQRQGSLPQGDAAAIQDNFLSAVKWARVTPTPTGLRRWLRMAFTRAASIPQRRAGTWSDPSESGGPGTSGGIMSWRNERLQNLQRFAADRGESPTNISPETQALFLKQEDPERFAALQAARTPEEAHDIMRNGWRFAGYDRAGGECGSRLATTRRYAATFGQPPDQAGAFPPQVQFGSQAPPVTGQPIQMAAGPGAKIPVPIQAQPLPPETTGGDNTTRAAAQRQVDQSLGLIAVAEAAGNKGIVEAEKLKIQPLMRWLEPTDQERTAATVYPNDPAARQKFLEQGATRPERQMQQAEEHFQQGNVKRLGLGRLTEPEKFEISAGRSPTGLATGTRLAAEAAAAKAQATKLGREPGPRPQRRRRRAVPSRPCGQRLAKWLTPTISLQTLVVASLVA